MQADSILFDLDGTLWDSVDEILYTWNLVLSRHSEVRSPISREEQESVMGMQMDEIANRLFPLELPARRMALMEECIKEENRYLERHGASLYSNVPGTLRQLAEKYRLFIVSNCQCGYIEAFLAAHKLGKHFKGFLCFGETKKSKGENIRRVITQYGLEHPVYVGDTSGDQRAAKSAEIPFIFAAYGFGQADAYAAKIDTFSELLHIF